MRTGASWIANGGLPAALVALVVLAGCGADGGTVPDHSGWTTEKAAEPNAKIALATTSTAPEIESINLGISKGEAAAINAPVNAAIGGAAGLAVCGRTVIGLLVWPVCIGVGAVAGAADGNLTVASSSYSAERLDEAEASALAVIDTGSLQSRMLERVEAYGRQNLGNSFGQEVPETLEAHERSADYAALSAQGFDAVLEVELTSIALSGRLEMRARARLVSVEDGTVLEDGAYGFSTPEHGPAHWMANDSRFLAEALERGMESLAADIVDEIFLLYYPSIRPSMTRWGAVPYYVLAPEYPPAEYTRTPFQVDDLAAPHIEPGAVATTPVTFRWERFPRSWDERRADGTMQNVDNVRYELKIFESVTAGSWSRPGPLIYQAVDLSQPEHRVSAKLQPCTEYLWTVRARFELDGRTRVTEWTGTYLPALGPEQPPWRLRRSASVPRASWFFMPFILAGKHGKCIGLVKARFEESREIEARRTARATTSKPRTVSVTEAVARANAGCDGPPIEGTRRVTAASFSTNGWTFGTSARPNTDLEIGLNRAGRRALRASPRVARLVSDWALERDLGEVVAGAHDLPGGAEYTRRLHREYAHLYAEKVHADVVLTFWYEQRGTDASGWQDLEALLIDMSSGRVHRAAGTPADAEFLVRSLLCSYAE